MTPVTIRENQWYHSPKSKRLFILKAIYGHGVGANYVKDSIVLVEVYKEEEITHKFEDFEKLILSKQLEKIS